MNCPNNVINSQTSHQPLRCPALLPGERVDDLQRGGLRIIQNPRAFCFGTDAVLLADFASARKGERVCDLGTGSGIIPILMSARFEARHYTAVELQPGMAGMAKRSVTLNGLEDKISIVEADIRGVAGLLGHGGFDRITCNPPYVRVGCGAAPEESAQNIARQELCVTLEDCVKSAGELLRNGGKACFIHQSGRLFELWELMKTYNLAPKRTRLVHPNADKPPNLVLAEGVKLGRPGVMWLAPLFVFRDGEYSDHIHAIYNGN